MTYLYIISKYRRIPAADVICSCDHQFSWPHAEIDDYGQILDYENTFYERYLGNYCDWVYESGPLEGVDFTETEGRRFENTENRNISLSGEILSKSGQLAAANLAQCNPAGCKADFAGDEGQGLKFLIIRFSFFINLDH